MYQWGSAVLPAGFVGSVRRSLARLKWRILNTCFHLEHFRTFAVANRVVIYSYESPALYEIDNANINVLRLLNKSGSTIHIHSLPVPTPILIMLLDTAEHDGQYFECNYARFLELYVIHIPSALIARPWCQGRGSERVGRVTEPD